ncbi:MAG: hypothetical protein J6Y35_01630 [Bacteroidales bacterium]|nr:hypothetical protein [Bacteroidales bacterium]
METVSVISIILNFVLGGTTLFGLIQWFSERRKRKLETDSVAIGNAASQAEVDDKEFETLKKQLDYQDERLNSYEKKMKERDKLDDEMREEMVKMKRCKYDLEMQAMRLQNQLAVKEEEYRRDACMVHDCAKRISYKPQES